MFYYDMFIIILASVQPLIVGFLVIFSIKNYFYSFFFYRYYNAIRVKTITTKLYECSTYSKLTSKYSYSIYTLSSCVMFIVYDVDLIFFFSETNSFINNSTQNLIVLVVLFFLFIVGFMFDYKYFTFNWNF